MEIYAFSCHTHTNNNKNISNSSNFSSSSTLNSAFLRLFGFDIFYVNFCFFSPHWTYTIRIVFIYCCRCCCRCRCRCLLFFYYAACYMGAWKCEKWTFCKNVTLNLIYALLRATRMWTDSQFSRQPTPGPVRQAKLTRNKNIQKIFTKSAPALLLSVDTRVRSYCFAASSFASLVVFAVAARQDKYLAHQCLQQFGPYVIQCTSARTYLLVQTVSTRVSVQYCWHWWWAACIFYPL